MFPVVVTLNNEHWLVNIANNSVLKQCSQTTRMRENLFKKLSSGYHVGIEGMCIFCKYCLINSNIIEEDYMLKLCFIVLIT